MGRLEVSVAAAEMDVVRGCELAEEPFCNGAVGWSCWPFAAAALEEGRWVAEEEKDEAASTAREPREDDLRFL